MYWQRATAPFENQDHRKQDPRRGDATSNSRPSTAFAPDSHLLKMNRDDVNRLVFSLRPRPSKTTGLMSGKIGSFISTPSLGLMGLEKREVIGYNPSGER